MFLYAGIARYFGLFRHFSYRKNLTNLFITPHVFTLKSSKSSSKFCVLLMPPWFPRRFPPQLPAWPLRWFLPWLQTLGLRRQGRIIVLPARRRPQAATPALRPGKIAPLIPMRENLLAHLPPGSAQTECIRLPYDAPPLSCGRICHGAKGPPGKQAGGERESRLSMAGALTVSRQWD